MVMIDVDSAFKGRRGITTWRMVDVVVNRREEGRESGQRRSDEEMAGRFS
jgi:hypothetical protein